MEANLRFAGPETMETKIFGRLTAWQNWIFQRPNAAGAEGALEALRHRREGQLQSGDECEGVSGQMGESSSEWSRTPTQASAHLTTDHSTDDQIVD